MRVEKLAGFKIDLTKSIKLYVLLAYFFALLLTCQTAIGFDKCANLQSDNDLNNSFEAAERFIDADNLSEAKAILDFLLKCQILKKESYPRSHLKLSILQATIFNLEGNPDDALASLEPIIAIGLEPSTYPGELAELYYQMALALLAKSEFAAARVYASKSERVLRELKSQDDVGLLGPLEIIWIAYIEDGNIDLQIETGLRKFNVYENNSLDASQDYIDDLAGIGFAYQVRFYDSQDLGSKEAMTDFFEAEEFLLKAYQMSQKFNGPLHEGTVVLARNLAEHSYLLFLKDSDAYSKRIWSKHEDYFLTSMNLSHQSITETFWDRTFSTIALIRLYDYFNEFKSRDQILIKANKILIDQFSGQDDYLNVLTEAILVLMELNDSNISQTILKKISELPNRHSLPSSEQLKIEITLGLLSAVTLIGNVSDADLDKAMDKPIRLIKSHGVWSDYYFHPLRFYVDQVEWIDLPERKVALSAWEIMPSTPSSFDSGPDTLDKLKFTYDTATRLHISNAPIKAVRNVLDSIYGQFEANSHHFHKHYVGGFYALSTINYMGLNNYEAAKIDLEKALMFDEDHKHMRLMIENYFFEVDSLEKEVKRIENEIGSNKSNCLILYHLGRSHFTLGVDKNYDKFHFEQALSYYSKAIDAPNESYPCISDYIINMHRAYTYNFLGRYTEMADLSTSAFDDFLDDMSAYDNLPEFALAANYHSDIPEEYLFNCYEIGLYAPDEFDEARQSCEENSAQAIELMTLKPHSHRIIEESLRVSTASESLKKKLMRLATTRESIAAINEQLVNNVIESSEPSLELISERTELEAAVSELMIDIETASNEADFLITGEQLTTSLIEQNVKKGEAILTIAHASFEEATFITLATSQGTWHVISEATESDFELLVEEVKKTVDLTRYGSAGVLPPFAADSAYEIYEAIFSEFEDELKDINAISLVTSGPLQNIPFNLLITENPAGTSKASKIAWAYKKFDFTKYPNIRTLLATRLRNDVVKSDKRFLGVGDPELLDSDGYFRGLKLLKDDEGPTKILVGNLNNLPETKEELLRMSSSFDPPPKSKLLLGPSATEEALRASNLESFDTIAFATHGLKAQEIYGLDEPALVLTPVSSDDTFNDGLLTVSEILDLKLNARLVVLSACNTNADTSMMSDGISGLSEAFLVAGAKSLLVSHWPIETNSAAELSSIFMKKFNEESNFSLSQALKFSIDKLREQPKWDHPAYWAPFSIVGDDSSLMPEVH